MTVTVSHATEMYIVSNENTLGYTIGRVEENNPVRIVVIAVSYIEGGDPTLIGRETLVTNYRPATDADKETFLFDF